MRFIPTRIHALLDYFTGMLLLASPWIFRFDHGSAETWLPILLGGGVMIYSLFTDYELAIARRIPMPVHLLIDIAGGCLLAASPWLFGFAHAVKLPHLFIGAGEVLVALLTNPRPTDYSAAGVHKHVPVVLLLLLAGCTASAADEPRPLDAITGLRDPEAALYDAEQDVIFISNMEGLGSLHDGRGYITRVSAADYSRSEVFVRSGANGVVLNAPKGMEIRDDVLWVADISVVREPAMVMKAGVVYVGPTWTEGTPR